MIWFTSDWHLDHVNIMKYCNRPFEKIEDMNQTIFSNFFDIIHRGDTVYFLGDLSFGQRHLSYFFLMLRDRGITVHFIIGNHDKDLIKFTKEKNFFATFSTTIQHLIFLLNIEIENQSVTLCHYPMLTFNKSHYGAWQLYGHHHNNTYYKNIPPEIMGKKMNIGVDVNNFKPVSWNQVKAYMIKQPNNFDLLKPEERH